MNEARTDDRGLGHAPMASECSTAERITAERTTAERTTAERTTAVRLAAIRAVVARIPDPELPVVTLEDLGILRDVVVDHGVPVVLLTPTYSGCPATEAIAAQVRNALEACGFGDARVRIVLSPAWTTDWLTEDARRKLRDYGIAPPACMAAQSVPAGRPTVAPLVRASGITAAPSCPRCGSADVESVSRWGSTPCKALYRCLACREPFDYFKPH